MLEMYFPYSCVPRIPGEHGPDPARGYSELSRGFSSGFSGFLPALGDDE